MAEIQADSSTISFGEYSGCNAINASVNTSALEWAIGSIELKMYDCIHLESIDATPMKEGEAFVICDYGAGVGIASMNLITEIIRYLKQKYGSKQEVHVIYEDQATNNYNSMFQTIHGVIPGCYTYLNDFNNVYVKVTCQPFLHQCLPTDSIHLGISVLAMHWMSQKPCNIPDSLYLVTSKDVPAKSLYAEQAAADWQQILLSRAKEIKPGGHFICANMCIDDDGNFSSKDLKVLMDNTWEELVHEGRITEQENAQITFAKYYRTRAEFTAPFLDQSSRVYTEGLRLIKYETRKFTVISNGGNTSEEVDSDDPTRQVKLLVTSLGAWRDSVFLNGLSDDRSTFEKRAIVDEFYKKCENSIACSPGDYGYQLYIAYLHIQKVIQ